MSPVNRPRPMDWTVRWCLGLLAGTILIGITSPMFVRTYASRQWDLVRSRNVYTEGLRYRWRSEGYATSSVGPHGMMGRIEIPTNSKTKIALWGDSQAEGVCLADEQKLWVTLQRHMPGTEVLPFAQSGDDASDWLEQFAGVEESLGINSHLILLHELSDLESLAIARGPNQTPVALPTWIDRVPDFSLEAGRRLVLTESNEIRRLRFALGPGSRVAKAIDADELKSLESVVTVWSTCAERLRRGTSLPITIAYAPHVSMAEDGGDTRALPRLSFALAEYEIQFIDCRESLCAAIRSGVQPFGFHHGQIGSGHFNSEGYQLLAEAVSKVMGTQPLQSTAGN